MKILAAYLENRIISILIIVLYLYLHANYVNITHRYLILLLFYFSVMHAYTAIGDIKTSGFISIHHNRPVMCIDEQMARIRSIFSMRFTKKPPSLENLQDLQMAVECFPNLVKHPVVRSLICFTVVKTGF